MVTRQSKIPAPDELKLLKEITLLYWQRLRDEVWHQPLDMDNLNEPRVEDLMALSYAMASTFQGMDQASQIGSGYSAEDLLAWANHDSMALGEKWHDFLAECSNQAEAEKALQQSEGEPDHAPCGRLAQ